MNREEFLKAKETKEKAEALAEELSNVNIEMLDLSTIESMREHIKLLTEAVRALAGGSLPRPRKGIVARFGGDTRVERLGRKHVLGNTGRNSPAPVGKNI